MIACHSFLAARPRVWPRLCCSRWVPQVRWEDVGGLEEVKQRLKEAVEWPFKNPEALERLGAQAPKGERAGRAGQGLRVGVHAGRARRS